MRQLSWADFDAAVAYIVAKQPPDALTGIYGVPRGGLPLAVALSHRLGLPLVDRITPSVLLVDDIRDSGRTIETFRTAGATGPIWAWVAREDVPTGYNAALTGVGTDWVVFPWEDPARAVEDRLAYEGTRA